jgi:hypothetical protein
VSQQEIEQEEEKKKLARIWKTFVNPITALYRVDRSL